VVTALQSGRQGICKDCYTALLQAWSRCVTTAARTVTTAWTMTTESSRTMLPTAGTPTGYKHERSQRPRRARVVEGVVDAVNETGVRVHGNWFNRSESTLLSCRQPAPTCATG
jgi:hypothetical protein